MSILVLLFYLLEKIIKLATNKKKYFIIITFILFFYNSSSNSLTNNVIVTIDNNIITELDLKKEINFIKFINKSEMDDEASKKIRKEILDSLIDRKIKKIEIDNAKIQISEKEIEDYLYNYLQNYKINNEILNNFYKTYQIETDYLKKIINIDIGWIKLIRKTYEGRININLTEINEQIKNQSLDIQDSEKIKIQIINTEKTKILNKFSSTHLEKSKKKYLIKFL